MCEPEVRQRYMSGGFCAIGCKCIQWDRITDSGRILKDEWDESDGLFTSRYEVISGEHDEVRRKVFYPGDPETSVRRWPPRRVQFCEGCAAAIMALMSELVTAITFNADVRAGP